MDRAEFIQSRQRAAWARGREVRDALMSEYQQRYGVTTLPAPARIVDELLRDFLNTQIKEAPLGQQVFAETEWDGERFIVTVNSTTASIAGVKDAPGVEAVGKWHEIVHIVDDAHDLKEGAQEALPGFDVARKIACSRSMRRGTSGEERAREFWAEEAGRAAAVSIVALARSASFREVIRLGERAGGRPVNGFPLLYRAAEDIGVNISALVKQLTCEGKLSVARESGRNLIVVQRELLLEVA